MPTFEATTKESNSVWRSPDGQREIFEVTLQVGDSEVKAKTYSKDIAVVDWTGSVESYEKSGRNGMETFVKQPPKEGGWNNAGGGYPKASPVGSPQSSTGQTGSRGFSNDNFTMYLSYAKDLAVALIGTKEGFDESKYGVLLDAVATGGETLYEAHNKPKAAEKEDEIISNEELDKMFDQPKEESWNKTQEA